MNLIENIKFNYIYKILGKWIIFLSNIGGENLLNFEINKTQDIKRYSLKLNEYFNLISGIIVNLLWMNANEEDSALIYSSLLTIIKKISLKK